VKELGRDIIHMDKNENPYDIPSELKKEILDYALQRSWSRYPPITALELYESIAQYTGWGADGVVAGNGSDEVILIFLLSFLEPGMKIVLPTPSFPMFRYVATLIGADIIEVPLKPDFTYDCDALEERFIGEGNLLIICSPNNPTGGLFPMDRLEQILKKSHAPVIMDEAYFEFSRVTSLNLLNSFDNLIVFRTFSKAFSLAGLRVGYALLNPALANEIGKVKLPFNSNFFSIAAASRLLKNSGKFEKVIHEIIQEREFLFSSMNSIKNITAYPSKANFILFRTPFESERVFEKILEDRILIRNLSANPLLAKTLRVTVSKPGDNRKFIDSLTRAMDVLAKE
jgi:histidinol-phosphate aminotransferase